MASAHPQEHAHESQNTKRDLRSWWKSFTNREKKEEEKGQTSTALIESPALPSNIATNYLMRGDAPISLFGVTTNIVSIAQLAAAPAALGIFGVPLQTSIKYANVAISLLDAAGRSFTYGYVPIVVAKCGVFLKEKGMAWDIKRHLKF